MKSMLMVLLQRTGHNVDSHNTDRHEAVSTPTVVAAAL